MSVFLVFYSAKTLKNDQKNDRSATLKLGQNRRWNKNTPKNIWRSRRWNKNTPKTFEENRPIRMVHDVFEAFRPIWIPLSNCQKDLMFLNFAANPNSYHNFVFFQGLE